jgi:hypothetical protein
MKEKLRYLGLDVHAETIAVWRATHTPETGIARYPLLLPARKGIKHRRHSASSARGLLYGLSSCVLLYVPRGAHQQQIGACSETPQHSPWTPVPIVEPLARSRHRRLPNSKTAPQCWSQTP